MKRLLTSLVLIPAAAYVMIWGPAWLFLLVASALAFGCFHEFRNLANGFGLPINSIAGYGLGASMLFVTGPYVNLLPLAGVIVLSLATFSGDLKKSMPQAGALLVGLVYVFGAWRAGIELRTLNVYWMLFAVSLNWAGDTMAYFAGRALGKHKLAPAISPGKSWEGAIASTLASCAYGATLLHYLMPNVDLSYALLLSAVANIAGQVGDLAESAFKRGAGVKDSGTFLPGHGGWLDRLDSSLFSMPVVYALVKLAL